MCAACGYSPFACPFAVVVLGTSLSGGLSPVHPSVVTLLLKLSTHPTDFPHIVLPALPAMDRIIVTPPGETLPCLGEDLAVASNLKALKALSSKGEDFMIGISTRTSSDPDPEVSAALDEAEVSAACRLTLPILGRPALDA